MTYWHLRENKSSITATTLSSSCCSTFNMVWEQLGKWFCYLNHAASLCTVTWKHCFCDANMLFKKQKTQKGLNLNQFDNWWGHMVQGAVWTVSKSAGRWFVLPWMLSYSSAFIKSVWILFSVVVNYLLWLQCSLEVMKWRTVNNCLGLGVIGMFCFWLSDNLNHDLL